MKIISRSEDGQSYVGEVKCLGCKDGGILPRRGCAIEVRVLIHGGVSKPVSCKYLTGNRDDMCKKFGINSDKWGYCRYVKMC